MMIRGLVLAWSLAHGVMAANDEGKNLRVRRLQGNVCYEFDRWDDFEAKIAEVANLGACPLYKEPFDLTYSPPAAFDPLNPSALQQACSNTPGLAGDLCYKTNTFYPTNTGCVDTDPGCDIGPGTNQLIGGVENLGGRFNDQLDTIGGVKEETDWCYDNMEAWGAYFNPTDPRGQGGGIKIMVMVDGDVVGVIEADEFVQFYGVVCTRPFHEVELVSDSGSVETYYLDDMYIFPWCADTNGNGIKGDPHIKTWNGQFLDYMGECDLVMLKQDNLDLHVRTTIRYDYSYVEAAALRIDDDILEVTSYGGHALNNVEDVLLDDNHGSTIGGHPIHYTRKSEDLVVIDVVISSQHNITFTAFKDIVSVTNQGTNALDLKESTGLMGSFFDGTLLGRDGVTVFDKETEADAFGQEWQVRDDEPNLFRTLRAPQYPMKCVLPSKEQKEARRRLGEDSVTKNAAEMACARFVGASFEQCVYDVMAYGDLGLATAGVY